MDYLQEIKRFHAEHVEPFRGKPAGCSQQEIAELEKQIGFPLPEAYRQFLEWMGKDYHGIFQGSDWFINHVVNNTKWLPGLLAENNVDFKLPEHYLAFFSHQGYMMAWLEMPKSSENPPAYFYTEGEEVTVPVLEGTFTDVLFKDMKGMAQFLSKPGENSA
jgi:hypothetical protein